MASSRLSLYNRLSRLPSPQSYTGKLFLVAFLGTHIPLLGTILYTVLTELSFADAWPILGVTLLATLVGTGLTLVALHRLLEPIRATTDALQAYREDDALPDLPTHYGDRAGQLMRDTQQTLTQLDALIQFQTRMLGVVSHDARGPATSILMAAKTIERQARSSDPDVALIESLTERVETAVEYQLNMTDSLLEVARYGEGELTLDVTRRPVEEVVGRVRDHLAQAAEQRNHTFRVETHAPAGLVLETDLQKLGQVLSNLVSNAIKYTPKGGEVTLTAATGDEDVVFRVSDTGNGIPDAVQDELFEAYRRADGPDPETKSLGLGLWICKTFTDALGGEISVEASSDEGTTFAVRFPRSRVVGAPA